MSSADTPLHSVASPHSHAHEPRDGHAHAPSATRAPLTLLGSGLGYRLGTAAALTAVLWAVVLWALA